MQSVILASLAVLLTCGGPPPAPAPSFFPLGGDVYHANDRFEAEKQTLRFDDKPRWFSGFPQPVTREVYEAWEKQQGKSSQQELPQGEPVYQIPTQPPYPRTAEALPLQNQGASLRLTAASDKNDAAKEISLTLTLTAGERAIQREIEHRRTNVLPFLFAIIADGVPVAKESSGGIGAGGSNRFIDLVPAKSHKSWTVRVALDSLTKLVPETTKELTLYAAFSERQHEGYSPEGPLPLGEVWSIEALKARPPQIVLRSNPLRLLKEGTSWAVDRGE